MKKGILISALAGGLALGATAAEANEVVKVSSGAELAAAIVSANGDSAIRTIRCVVASGCDFVGTLPVYTGTQGLTVDGNSSTIDASGITDSDVFTSVGGGNVKLVRLTLVGGMSGVYVEVPADETGTQRVILQRVTVQDANLHGVFVNDGNFSNASVRLVMTNARVLNNGFGDVNQDGVRVNETSKGAIRASITNSTFRGNASDGMSLNERSGGAVNVTVENSDFLSNGTNPLLAIDPEDGLDIDEFGPGDVWLTVTGSRFNKNEDDGLDVDESNGGTIFSNLVEVFATKNLDLGVTYEESENDDLFLSVSDSVVMNNNGGNGGDLVGVQGGNGTGTVTVDGGTVGDASVSGLQLIMVP